jgi:hypothetical protein
MFIVYTLLQVSIALMKLSFGFSVKHFSVIAFDFILLNKRQMKQKQKYRC